ncbi:hypothetical protein [Vitiosangium sp. GDMCC 1.1324]|uniref:hypothetical protein n=1 Tax=Vitiosangium sp. (strain GDMCC 1.1324) TaxID=2138576 RepID=UPI000D3433DD|nr:hypothetical protein [Vitiosangium sp. GDMCC 1.1324]PTL75176.1 hypothetical protein DAT35_56310 [Vitiosangium sp. GDMCC 1.1324]
MKKKAPGSQAQREKTGNGSTGANVLLAVAAAANMACPGAQVREEPAPQACPAGAVETMTRQLGLRLGERHGADMPGEKQGSSEPVPVKEGPISLELAGAWKAGADAMGRGRRVVLPGMRLLFLALLLGLWPSQARAHLDLVFLIDPPAPCPERFVRPRSA